MKAFIVAVLQLVTSAEVQKANKGISALQIRPDGRFGSHSENVGISAFDVSNAPLLAQPGSKSLSSTLVKLFNTVEPFSSSEELESPKPTAAKKLFKERDVLLDKTSNSSCTACKDRECEEKLVAPGKTLSECSEKPSDPKMGFSPHIYAESGGDGNGMFTMKLYSQADPQHQWPTKSCTGIDKCDKPVDCVKPGKVLRAVLDGSEGQTVCADFTCESSSECLIRFSITFEEVDVAAAKAFMFKVKLIAAGVFVVFCICPLFVGFFCFKEQFHRKLEYVASTGGACCCFPLHCLGYGQGKGGKGQGKGYGEESYGEYGGYEDQSWSGAPGQQQGTW